jgi:hypothetical protein
VLGQAKGVVRMPQVTGERERVPRVLLSDQVDAADGRLKWGVARW